MELKECYARMGGDFADVLARLRKEERIAKLLRMVPEDGSMAALEQALHAGDGAAAFRASHSLKGIAMNLGLSPLGEAAGKLTEALRGGSIPENAPVLLAAVQRAHGDTLAAIRAFLETA